MKKLLLIKFSIISIFSFCQTLGGGVSDIDGNSYETVIIGSQEWTSENLKTTKYSDGSLIPEITDGQQWSNLLTGARVFYNNDNSNNAIYGILYNWYVVSDARNVCPIGWRVPTSEDWDTLTNFLGGLPVAGGKMKDVGTTLWQSPNQNASNSSGFTGLPGGFRNYDGTFFSNGQVAYFYSSSLDQLGNAKFRGLFYGSEGVDNGAEFKTYGYSVRCLKDDSQVGIIEIQTPEKKLIHIYDLMGREIEFKPNTILIYVYSDGTTERILVPQ
jgi:uncharacterized protein (TIGR02145 family)